MKLPPPRVRILRNIFLCRAGQRMSAKTCVTVSGLWAGEEQNGDEEEIDGEKSKRKVPLIRRLPPNADTVRSHWPYFTCFPLSMQAPKARTESIQFSFPSVFALRKNRFATQNTQA